MNRWLRLSKRSIQTSLLVQITWVVLGLGVLTTGVAFGFAYAEAQEFQDDMLRQVALLGTPTVNPTFDAGQDEENDARIRVFVPARQNAPDWLPPRLADGFYTMPATDGSTNRVYATHARNGQRLVIVQSTQSRNEVAWDSALWTFLPWLLFLPILLWLIVHIVRHELLSVRSLSAKLDQQITDRLETLPVEAVPEEIVPFVDAVNRMMLRVNLAVVQQKRFIADASHELRTPLTALSLQAQNIERADTIDAMRQRVVVLRTGIDRARQLTSQLLDLARLQYQEQRRDTIRVGELARDSLAGVLPLAESRSVDLRLDLHADPLLQGDAAILQLIMHNVLGNAVKYSHPGESVTLRTSLIDNKVTIDVIDQGDGIPEDQRQQVFQPFYRLPGNAATGSGLGLAIAHEAADRLGGKLTILSNPKGKGVIVRYQQPQAMMSADV